MPTVNDRLKHVTLKVKRAKEHVSDLERNIGAFLDTHPYVVDTKIDPQTREVVYYIVSVKDTPPCLPLIAGDAVQNLMSTLDHLAYQLVCVDTKDNPPDGGRWIYFPIANSIEEYETKRNGKIKGASDDTRKAIDLIKPYKGGNDLLWMLRELNNVEKHRLLITVGSVVASVDLGSSLSAMAKKLMPNSNIPAIKVFFKLADPMFPLKAGDILGTDHPDSEPDAKNKHRFEVAISELGVIEGKPLLETLHQMTDMVEGIVTALAPRLS